MLAEDKSILIIFTEQLQETKLTRITRKVCVCCLLYTSALTGLRNQIDSSCSQLNFYQVRNVSEVQRGRDANVCFYRREMHQPLHCICTVSYTHLYVILRFKTIFRNSCDNICLCVKLITHWIGRQRADAITNQSCIHRRK